MSEIAKYLRFLVQADKEAVVSVVAVTDSPAQQTTSLTGGNTRKAIGVYNNSDTSSGECYYGFSNSVSSSNGMPLTKGIMTNIPVAYVDAIDLYFVAESGELGELRVIELS